MPVNARAYAQMAVDTAKQITGSYQSWTACSDGFGWVWCSAETTAKEKWHFAGEIGENHVCQPSLHSELGNRSKNAALGSYHQTGTVFSCYDGLFARYGRTSVHTALFSVRFVI